LLQLKFLYSGEVPHALICGVSFAKGGLDEMTLCVAAYDSSAMTVLKFAD
jgi:hypothetical protein